MQFREGLSGPLKGYIQSDGPSAVLLPETLIDHFLVGVVARVCAWCRVVPFTH